MFGFIEEFKRSQSWAHLWESPSTAASAKCTNKMSSCCFGVPRKRQCLPCLLQSLSSGCLSQPRLQKLLFGSLKPLRSPGGRQVVAAAERNWFSQREKITSFTMAGCLSLTAVLMGTGFHFLLSPCFCFFSKPVCGNSPHVPELGGELQTTHIFSALIITDFSTHLFVHNI